MNNQTQTRKVSIKTRKERLMNSPSEAAQLPERKNDWGIRFLQLDRLARNMAVVGGLALVLIAVKNSGNPEAASVFSALRENSSMRWDESIGKLSFVNSLLPEEIQVVWNDAAETQMVIPMDGKVVHAWSVSEPYLLVEGNEREVCAAAEGEVMSIAHGVDEERIVRIRHNGYTETVYGNLTECYVECGTTVAAGEVIGEIMADKPLAFEVRLEGRSVNPDNRVHFALE